MNPILWIEVPASAVSGGSGSQIDIPNDAARFFFSLQPGLPFRENIEIHYGANVQHKLMDWRGDPGLNHQFRLNLLTTNQGGPPSYDNTVLVIELLSPHPNISINTRVLAPNSSEARALRINSQNSGTLYQTIAGQPGSRYWGLL